MILPHPMLNEHIDVAYIEHVAEREGYEKFIPYTFLRHLIYVFSFYKVGRYPFDCIQERNPYTNEFRRVLSMIRFQDIKTDNPVIFAIRVLKILSYKTNLRALETSATTGTTFATSDDCQAQNYKFDLYELSPAQLATLDLEDKNLDTVELSAEVLKLLLLYDGMEMLEQPIDPQYNVIKKQITSYADFYKGKRYKLALPTFKVDLGLKKLQITKVDDKEVLASEVILAIDYSFSMGSNPLSRVMIRSVLLHYIKQLEKNSNLTLTILYVVGGINTVDHIESVQALQTVFSRLREFTLPTKPATNIFSEIGLTYAGRSVVFLTDGRIDLKSPLKLNYKLYSVVLTPNDILKQTCLLSGGQFIVLE